MKFEVYCRYEEYGQFLNVYIFQVFEDGARGLITNLDKMEVTKHKDGAIIEKPTFTLRGRIVEPFLKAFANELERIGIRAEGKPVLENELTAVKYHLEDMRTLVFNKEAQ